MKMKLKRGELVSLNMILNEMVNSNESYGKIFNFGVLRNIEYFASEIKIILESQKKPARFQEFQERVQQIGIECSDKDEQGNPKTDLVNGNPVFVIKEKKEEANKRMVNLQMEYLDVIEDQKKNIEQFNLLMDEEIEMDYCPISFKYFPDKYFINHFKIIKKIIKETNEEIEKEFLS